MKQILNLIENIKKNKYYVYKVNKDFQLPEKINIKSVIYYFLMFLQHRKKKDTYFIENIDFIIIPDDWPKIKNMNEFIDLISYIKYNVNGDEEIDLIINDDFNKMKLNRLKNICRCFEIKKIYGKKKKELIDLVLNN